MFVIEAQLIFVKILVIKFVIIMYLIPSCPFDVNVLSFLPSKKHEKLGTDYLFGKLLANF